jgi:hypothetical protein
MYSKLIKLYSVRNKKLKEMGFSSYSEYLSSKLWKYIKNKAKRKEAFKYCVICGGEDINLHHIEYNHIDKNTLVNIIPTCFSCHQKIHKEANKNNISLKSAVKIVKKRFKRECEKRYKNWLKENPY